MDEIIMIISLVLGIPIGIFFFMLLNELFDIYYFGCAGVTSTFGGCVAAGFGIVYFLLTILGFLIVPIIILCLIGGIVSKKKDKS